MPTPTLTDRLHHDANESSTPDPPSPFGKFRKKLRAGSYDALIGAGLRHTLRGAAADDGLEVEIGALRLTLVRLLNEESDPTRLAAGVSRIAGVAVQAARVRNTPDADVAHIRSFLERELDILEREIEEGQNSGSPHDPNQTMLLAGTSHPAQ